MQKGYMFSIAVMIIGSLIGVFFCDLSGGKNKNRLIAVFLSALCIRFILAILLRSISLEGGGYFLGDDDWCYGMNSATLSNAWHNSFFAKWDDFRPLSWNRSLSVYDYLNSMVYYFTGANSLSIISINCLFGSLVVIVVYAIAKEIFGDRAAFVSSCLAAFWPSLIFWSALNLKDVITSFLIVLAAMSFVFLYKPELRLARRAAIACGALVSLYLINLCRESMAFILILGVFFSSLILNRKFWMVVIVIIYIAVFFLLIRLFVTEEYKMPNLKLVNKAESVKERAVVSTINSISLSRNWSAGQGRLAIFPGITFKTPRDIALYLPFGIFVCIFAPFPWDMVSNVKQLAVLPEMAMWYLAIFFAVKGMIRCIRMKLKTALVPFFLITVLFLYLALMEGNAGTLMRHRAPVMYLVFIFAAGGFLSEGPKKQGLS